MKSLDIEELFVRSIARPFVFLATEPVIWCVAAYNGYLFGLTFLFDGAFGFGFGEMGPGFNTIGFITNIWQERYYLRRVNETGGKNIPEARLQMSMVGAGGEFVVCVSGRQTIDGDSASGVFILVCLTTYTSIYASIFNPPDLLSPFYATTSSRSILELKKSVRLYLTNGYAVDPSYHHIGVLWLAVLYLYSHDVYICGRYL